jgi:predicted phage terminase large subunit-like protein
MSNIVYHGKRLTLFNIAKYMLGYEKITKDVHKKWCDDLEEAIKTHKRIMRLKPRGTYKTTIYDVSFVIDRLLDDYVKHDGKFTLRILITSATNDLAEQILYEITQHLTENENIKQFFADFGNDNPIVKLNQQEVVLHPRIVKKEPNLKARGALAALTSEHYDIIICDDVINTEDRESATIREQKKRWYKDLISILEPDGLIMIIGTRWSDADLYGDLIEQNQKIPEYMRYDIEVDSIIDETGKPKYPSIYNEQKIQSLRIEKGAVEFSSQYLNQPLPAETQLFKIDSLHYYTELKLPQERAQNPYFKNCKHVIYVDPALGNENDFCVIIVGAIKDHVLYVRDCWLSNTSPPNVSIEKMVYYYNFYNCEELGIETNGFQSLISQYLKERNDKIKDMRKRMKIKEIKNQKKKRIRIESVEPFVTSGKVLFRDDWTEAYPELINQLVRYPVHKHDDAPDALEGLVRMTINKGSALVDKGTRKKRKFMIGINRSH